MKVASALVLFAAQCLARPDAIGVDRKYDSSRDVPSQQFSNEADSSVLPSKSLRNSPVPVLMYFPDYNALLVPAESISPDYLPSAKRRQPISNLINLIKTRVNDDQTGEASTPALVVPEEADANNNLTANTVPIQQETSAPIEISHQKRPGVLAPEIPQPEKNAITSQPSQFPTYKQEAQPNTFGPFTQLFQRPNPPIFPTFQASRPDSPAMNTNFISNFLHTPVRLPFANLLNIRLPFQDEVPRTNPYVHYYTRTPTSEAYFYNSLTPRTVPDPLQIDYTDYLASVQETLLGAQQSLQPTTTNPATDSTMMVASVPVGKNQATSLLLRPVAKAVAGPKGVAVASPVAKAVLRKGEKVDIDFDPDAVAIAGPGGQAHAHPKLIVSYTNDTNLE